MSKRLLATILTSLTLGGHAFADDAQTNGTKIDGTVNRVCGVNQIIVPSQGNVTSVQTEGGMAILFNNFVNPEDSTPLALNLKVNIEAKCNYAHSLNVRSQSGGLKLLGQSPNSDGFSTRRDYLTQVNWVGLSGGFQTNGNSQNAVDLKINGAAKDVMTISLTAPPSDRPLVAGSYSDVIFVNLHGAP